MISKLIAILFENALIVKKEFTVSSVLNSKNCTGKNIIIMAGGTGGHVFPALAVARCFKQKGATVSWVGTKLGIETKIVPAEFEIDYIKVSGVRKKNLRQKLSFPMKLISAILQAKSILKKRQAHIVIGFGGYASGPGGIAAYLSKIPLIIHEQNAIPGMTNRYLSKISNLTLLAFPYSKLKAKSKVIGNPLREEIKELNNNIKIYNKTEFNILILGGSLGAKMLNDIVPKALEKLKTRHGFKVIHQSGEKLYSETIGNYASITTGYEIKKFIDNMAEVYKWADIIICRSGASTVSEVAAAGIPAIFIPYPHAVDDHQYHNAKFLADAKAAVIFRQSELSPNKLAEVLDELFTKPEILDEMSKNSKNSAVINATEEVASVVLKYLQ